jgi:hypothetical protein
MYGRRSGPDFLFRIGIAASASLRDAIRHTCRGGQGIAGRDSVPATGQVTGNVDCLPVLRIHASFQKSICSHLSDHHHSP